GPRCGRGRVHYPIEVFLRRQLRDPQSAGADQRRTLACALYRQRCETNHLNGELNKIAHNVSFGHGILSGIHWRSDSDSSMVLGEAVAISVLQDKAQCYNEKFTV